MAESTSTASPNTDPRFVYQSITPPAISPDMLNRIATSVFDPTTGVLGLVKAIVMASFATMYFIIWEKMQAAQEALAKQQYEAGLGNQSQTQIDQDPLSGQKKGTA